MNPHGSTYTLRHLWPQLSPLQSKVHLEESVAMEESVLQQAHLVVSMSVNKAMPQYLEAAVAVNKSTTQQVSDGAVGNGKGCTRAGTPGGDCGCG